MSRPTVSVLNLGRLGYVPALNIQQEIAKRHLDHLAESSTTPGQDTIIIVEHNPVYTIGKRENQYTNQEEMRLKGLGAEFYRSNRGGLITFHGHGQLVAYPILNLANFTKGMRWYVGRLEQTIIQLCDHYGIKAKTTCDTGVWVENNKIAAIGVHARRFVTSHGIAINCNTDLAWYKHIIPCGLPDKGVTSLSKELNCDITVNDTIEPFIDAFSKQFHCNIRYERGTRTNIIIKGATNR